MSWKTIVIGIFPWEKSDNCQSNGKSHSGAYLWFHVTDLSTLTSSAHTTSRIYYNLHHLLVWILCWFVHPLEGRSRTPDFTDVLRFNQMPIYKLIKKELTKFWVNKKELNAILKFPPTYKIIRKWFIKGLQTEFNF